MDIERDVSMEISTKNHKANPFGWSTSEVWHENEKIGSFYCGYPEITKEGYRFEVVREDEKTERLKVWATKDEDEWKAFDFAKEFKPVSKAD